MAVKKGFLSPLLLVVAPPLYSLLSRLLFATCRVTSHGDGYLTELEGKGQPFIAAFWHCAIFYVVHRARGRRWVAMVSASADGEYIARILQGMGYATVRGSRSRSGLSALRGMISAMQQERLNGAIVADGSQGPARRAQAGVILLAGKTGNPILPVAWAADRCWLFRSWDRTVLPKPFARISLHHGEPLPVPEQLDSEALEAYRLELEKRLNGLYAQAWLDFGRESHDGLGREGELSGR